jgi:hypothetical protein
MESLRLLADDAGTSSSVEFASVGLDASELVSS